MFALFGLLGAMLAGVLAESVMAVSDRNSGDDEGEDDAHSPQMAVTDTIPIGGEGAETAGFAYDGHATDDLADSPDPGLVLHGDDFDNLISGGGAADSLTGGAGKDQIDAGAGDDTVDGGDGDDILWGGFGQDFLLGDGGNDQLHGDAGDDTLYGASGADSLCGHEGDDSLDGGFGLDTLIGGMGADSLYGGGDDDWLAGGEGDDWLEGGTGSDTLDGGAGADTLYGAFPEGDDGEVDYLNGGDGDDHLYLGAGDYGTGGAGADTFTLSQWLGEGGYATIADYDAAEDQIVVVYDAAAHADPQLTLEGIDGTEDVQILLDGAPIGLVAGAAGLRLSQITLLAA